MFNKTKLTIAAVAALLLATALVAQGPGPRARRGPGMGPMGGAGMGPDLLRGMIAQKLDLTAEQREAAKAIREASREETQPLVAQLRENREKMQAAIEAGNAGEAEFLAGQQGALTGQLAAIHAKSQIRIYNEVLTAAQRQTLADLRAEMQSRMEERREARRKRLQEAQ